MFGGNVTGNDFCLSIIAQAFLGMEKRDLIIMDRPKTGRIAPVTYPTTLPLTLLVSCALTREKKVAATMHAKILFLFLLRPFVMGPPIQSKQPHSPKYTQSIFESCHSGKCHKYKENNSADDDSSLNSPFSFFVQVVFV